MYSGIFTFLVDAYPTYAASALAANSFTRSTFGAVFPLFGIQSTSSASIVCIRSANVAKCTTDWDTTGRRLSWAS